MRGALSAVGSVMIVSKEMAESPFGFFVAPSGEHVINAAE